MPSSPRPILKLPPSPTLTATSPLPFPSSRLPLFDSPRVHFPPTPTMTQMEITHSSFTYDRKPIVVLPNVCALPERGDRSIDSSECDLEVWAPARRKKKAVKGGYFHPRAFEVVEYESVEGEQPDLPCSLLFTRDASPLSSSYRLHSDALNEAQQARTFKSAHFRTSIQTIGALDASDAGCGEPLLAHGQMDACQFMQHIPHMDLSLSFMPPKQSALRNSSKPPDCPSSHKKRGTARSRTITGSTNNFERTRKVVSNAGCAGFNSGFYEPGLEGCLGGF